MTLPAVLKKAIPVYAGDSFGVPLILRDEVTQEPSDLSTWGGLDGLDCAPGYQAR